MRIGVVSDAHGNLAGFEACLADMGPVDRLVFTGDLLGYYFDGALILRKLRALGAICLAGNHDLYFLTHQGRSIAHALQVPAPALYREKYGPSLERAARELSPGEIDWLAGLSCDQTLEVGERRVRFVHGSPARPADEYVYPDDSDLGRFGLLDADVVVMGHTHRPMLRTAPGGCRLFNVGSCGQPRDGDPRACYGVIELRDEEVGCTIHRVEYDREPLLARCRELAPEVPLLTNLLLRDSRSTGTR